MERHVNVEEVRKKANAFLQDLLNHTTAKSTEEISRSITNLAFESSNPVRDLFLAAISNESTSLPHSPKLRSSKILRLARREHKNPSPASKTPILSPPHRNTEHALTLLGKGFAQQNVGASSSRKDGSDGKQAEMEPSFQPNEKSSNEAGTVPFNCIICNEDMSSKGVCKRHLDEQHVSPKMFRCEKCGKDYATKAEAKKHCNSCGVGIFTWTIVKQQPKKVYASEFTEEWFSSKSTYLEHLLKLSKKDAVRPQSSLHCKLRALLNHPSLRHQVDNVSQGLYGSVKAWRSMHWTEEQLQSAIEDLEEAVVVHENGVIEFGGIGPQKSLHVHLFLQNLLYAGILAETSQDIPPMHDMAPAGLHQQDLQSHPGPNVDHRADPVSASPSCVPSSPMDYMPAESNVPLKTEPGSSADAATFVSQDLKAKRHLSDDSRFFEQTREPQGPLSPPMHFQSAFSATKNDSQRAQIPNMAPAMLPYRIHEGAMIEDESVQGGLPQIQPYGAHPLMDVSYSAAASETTLVPGYQEPELQQSASASGDYRFWAHNQSSNFGPNLDNSGKGGLPYHPYPSETSIRTPSIATDQTCVDMSEEDHKMEAFASLATFAGTAFNSFPLERTDQHRFYGMNQ